MKKTISFAKWLEKEELDESFRTGVGALAIGAAMGGSAQAADPAPVPPAKVASAPESPKQTIEFKENGRYKIVVYARNLQMANAAAKALLDDEVPTTYGLDINKTKYWFTAQLINQHDYKFVFDVQLTKLAEQEGKNLKLIPLNKIAKPMIKPE